MNTAVPGTRCGFSILSEGRKRSSATIPRCISSASSTRPRFQVTSTVKIAAPMTRGSQAPWVILSMLAERNGRSMQRNSPISAPAASRPHRQRSRATV